MSNITRQLARFVSELTHDALPEAAREMARMVVLDHVGIALRARHEAELVPAMRAGLEQLGQRGGECRVIGDTEGYTPPAAALFNGNLGHALDFDDTHSAGSIHSGAPIIPAALAVAETCGADGRTLLTAIVAGFEVQIRLSLALDPSEHYKRGFHPTATCGVFGAAAAAGVLLGLDEEAMERAFGLCGSHAAGSMQFLVDGSWNKPYHAGFAAANGVNAAIMAQAGFKGAREALEGRLGFLRAYAPDPDASRLIDGLGERWEMTSLAIKPYPSCRYSHAAMDAIIELQARHHFDEGEIESIEIGLNANGMSIIGEPIGTKHQPKNYVDGQFSMPFCAAVALREGGMDWDSYERHLTDPATLELCRKVTCVLDEGVDSEFPANMSGAARIRTARGTFEHLVVVPKGEPDNALDRDELRAKFDGLVAPYLSESRRDTLAERLFSLERQSDIRALLALTEPDLGHGDLRLAGAGDD